MALNSKPLRVLSCLLNIGICAASYSKRAVEIRRSVEADLMFDRTNYLQGRECLKVDPVPPRGHCSAGKEDLVVALCCLRGTVLGNTRDTR